MICASEIDGILEDCITACRELRLSLDEVQRNMARKDSADQGKRGPSRGVGGRKGPYRFHRDRERSPGLRTQERDLMFGKGKRAASFPGGYRRCPRRESAAQGTIAQGTRARREHGDRGSARRTRASSYSRRSCFSPPYRSFLQLLRWLRPAFRLLRGLRLPRS